MSLTSDFFDEALAFARERSICPPNNVSGYKGQ